MVNFVGSLERCPHCGSYADKFCTNEFDGLGMMPFGISCNGCPATVTLHTHFHKYPNEEDWARARDFWNKRSKPV